VPKLPKKEERRAHEEASPAHELFATAEASWEGPTKTTQNYFSTLRIENLTNKPTLCRSLRESVSVEKVDLCQHDSQRRAVAAASFSTKSMSGSQNIRWCRLHVATFCIFVFSIHIFTRWKSYEKNSAYPVVDREGGAFRTIMSWLGVVETIDESSVNFIRQNTQVKLNASCSPRYDDMCFALEYSRAVKCSNRGVPLFPMKPTVVKAGKQLLDGNWMYIYTTNNNFIVAPSEWKDFHVVACSEATGKTLGRRFSHACLVPDDADLLAAGFLTVEAGQVSVVVSSCVSK